MVGFIIFCPDLMCWKRSSLLRWLEVSLSVVQNYTWILYLNNEDLKEAISYSLTVDY